MPAKPSVSCVQHAQTSLKSFESYDLNHKGTVLCVWAAGTGGLIGAPDGPRWAIRMFLGALLAVRTSFT